MLKNIAFIFVMATFAGCGDEFVTTSGIKDTYTGGTGGSSIAGTGGVGGLTLGGAGGSDGGYAGTMNIGGVFSAGGGGGGTTDKFISLSNCTPDFVFVPYEGYGLNNSPAVSCVGVPDGQASLTISKFTYHIFQGTVHNPEMDCAISDHNAVNFITTLNVNGDIPDDVWMNESLVFSNDLTYNDIDISKATGVVAGVTVTLSSPITITGDEVFCFGHRLTFDNQIPTCLLSCLKEENYLLSQVSDAENAPFNFNPANAFPADGDVDKHFNFVSEIIAQE